MTRPNSPAARIFHDKSRTRTFQNAGIFLLLLYVLAGIIYSIFLAPITRFSDEHDYLVLTSNLLHGHGFSMDGIHPTAGKPPGYIFFLSTIGFFGGGFFSFRVAQFLLLGATVLLVARIGSGKIPFAGVLLAAALAISYPVLFYTAATLYPQTVSGFLFVLSMTLLLAARRGLPMDVLTGVGFGALILVVPTFLLTLFVTIAVAGWWKIIRWREAAVILVAAGLLVGAWTARNAICFHRFVPVASNSGLNFLMGNNGGAVPDEGVANSAMVPYYVEAERLGLDEFQADHYYMHNAVLWIEAHPGRALALYLGKVANFFNIINVYHSREEISAWKQAVMAASYLLLLGLLAWRLAEWKQFPLLPREKLFLAIYVLSAFTSAIFVTRIRYRLPYDCLIIAIVALHLSRHLERWMNARK